MNKTPNQIRLGLELNATETAISIGKQVVDETIASQPVDADMLDAQRAQLHQSRLTRNELRGQLEQARREAPLRYRWTI